MYYSEGFHGGNGGNHTGIKEHWLALNAANVPFFCKSIDGYKIEAVDIAAANPTTPHIVIFRLSTAGQNDGYNYDVPNYNTTPLIAASTHWNRTKAKLPPEFNKNIVWVEPINEVDKNRASWVGEFMYEFAALANADGYKVCGPSWSSGEPEPSHWETPGMLKYLTYCSQNINRAAISVHEYDYGMQGFANVYPWHIGRYKTIFDVCEVHNIPRPQIFITEFGWAMTSIPPLATCISELDWAYRNVYGPDRKHVKGAAIWCLQKYQGDVHNQVQKLIVPVTGHMLNLPNVPISPDPGVGDRHKVVVISVPQKTEISKEDYAKVTSYAYNDYLRSVCASPDDVIGLIQSVGDDDSYVKVFKPDSPSQQYAIQLFDAAGITWQELLLEEHTHPLHGITLHHILPYRYMLTSPFNAPRNYGLHEGADYDIIGGGQNNVVSVLCMYPGIVDRSLDSTGGYGKYVRVRHLRNGKTFYTRYAHLDARYVVVGDTVNAGTPLGEIGTTGNATGEHVHINIEVPGYGLPGYVVANVVDPEQYMANGRNDLPYIPTTNNFDLSRFMIADPLCWRVVRHIDSNGNISQEDVQDMLLSGGMYVRRKNSLAEWWRKTSTHFELLHDTSPSNGTQNIPRVYTITKNGLVGAPKNPIMMQQGVQWSESGNHHVQFRAKSDCKLLGENSGYAQNSAILIDYKTNYTFNTFGQNLTFDEVIWIKTGVETQLYGRIDGKPAGWIGWAAPWGSSEPVEIHWDRGAMTHEPNRYCNWE